MAESAVEKDSLSIPLIDFSLFLHGTPSEKKTVAAQALAGFRTAGFIYIKNHGIPASQVTSVFSQSAAFFKLPQEQKHTLAWYSPEGNRGYTAHGREKVTQLSNADDVAALREANPDLKESLEIGRDDETEFPNMWPSQGSGSELKWATKFREETMAFFETCKLLHMQVMQSIAVGLGLEEDWFDGFTDGGDNTLRLLHYPGVKKEVFERNKGQVRAGEHTDYGSITLLFQDSRGGLQVESPKGTFVDATPIPNTIVINAGDLLARWSNDFIRSTTHRVVEPPPDPKAVPLKPEDEYPARYSIAYFCNPNFDRIIEAIPGTYVEGEKRYEAVNSGEYLVKRLSATY